MLSADISEKEFNAIVAEELEQVPAKFKKALQTIAVLVERVPSAMVRDEEGLSGDETLLGLYRGVPLTERGEGYGIGGTLPDTITLYIDPIVLEATVSHSDVRQVVRETLWHEIGHYYGLSEDMVEAREKEGTNRFI